MPELPEVETNLILSRALFAMIYSLYLLATGATIC